MRFMPRFHHYRTCFCFGILEDVRRYIRLQDVGCGMKAGQLVCDDIVARQNCTSIKARQWLDLWQGSACLSIMPRPE